MREKQICMYKEAFIKLSTDFSAKIFRLEGSGRKYAKSWKAENLQPRTLYPAILSLTKEKRVLQKS